MKPSFRIVPVASALHDTRAIADLQATFTPALERMGGALWEDPTDPSTPVLWFVLTGGTEQRLLDAIADHEARLGAGPVLLLSHRGQNSLPAALETLARLQQDGRKGRVVHLEGAADEDGISRLVDAVHDLEVWRRLHQLRVGVLGRPSDWLVASVPDPQDLRASWGPTMVPVAMEEIFGLLDAARGEGSAGTIANAEGRPPSCCEVDSEAVRDAGLVAHAMETIVKVHRLDAITVRCFDLVTARQTTGCHALARLNDQGVTAACEGDLASAVGMAWVRAMLGVPSWMANPASIDELANSILLAHCTVPRSMVGDCGLRTHFESGLGVALAGQFATGPVTLLRVGGRRLEKVWMSDGDLVSTSAEEGLCRTQVRVCLREGSVSDLLRRPLGNHLVMVRGHHASRLRAWWESFGPA